MLNLMKEVKTNNWKKLVRAPKNFWDEQKVSRIELVMENKDNFHVIIGADPPVDVPPMIIEFKGEERA